MKIYTRTGDKGKTGIVGGMLVDKDDVRIETNGILDEANSFIGVLRTKIPEKHVWQEILYKIQVDIMNMMSHIATHSSVREKNSVDKPEDGAAYCEKLIDQMQDEMDGPHDFFILPGGTEVSALCHVVRTKLRTTERRLVSLHKKDPVESYVMKYVNRLSDLFFCMSRYDLFKEGLSEDKLRPFKLPMRK